MVEIIPFKGLRYDYSKISDLSQVMAPPYDVISDEKQEELYEVHEKNIVRIDFGKDFPDDDENHNKYTRAREYFEKWQEEGTLVRDPRHSFYLYGMEYRVKTRTMHQWGFICLARLERFQDRVILPHEEVLKGPLEDRLRLMRECGSNFSPIYAMFSEKEQTIDKELKGIAGDKPDMEAMDSYGTRHRLWKVDDENVISHIQGVLKNKHLYIADGHHRYTTALHYRDEMRVKTGKKSGEPFDYTMVYLTNMEAAGITILPAHRVIKKIGIQREKVLEGLREFLDLEEVDGVSEMIEGKERKSFMHAFGLYFDGQFYVMNLKVGIDPQQAIKDDRSRSWKKLDVAILHKIIIENILGLPAEKKEQNLEYDIDEDHAVKKVDEGKAEMVIFLNPTGVHQVKDISLDSERMPGKATYFYPKLLTGLVFNKF